MAAARQTDPEPLMSIPEVAKRLNVSSSSVLRLLAQGAFPAVKLGHSSNSSVRVERRVLEEWLQQESA